MKNKTNAGKDKTRGVKNKGNEGKKKPSPLEKQHAALLKNFYAVRYNNFFEALEMLMDLEHFEIIMKERESTVLL